MTCTLTIDGQDRDILIPSDAGEITYGQYWDFVAEEVKFVEYNKDRDTYSTEQIFAALAEAVAVICGPTTHDLPIGIEGDNYVQLVDQGYLVTIGDDLSLLRLYAHITTVIRTCNYSDKYQPKTLPWFLEIKHGADKFIVHAARATRIMTGRSLSAGEALEVQEYRRVNDLKKKAGKVSATDLDFTLGLTEFAILVRKKNERLPVSEAEREQWLSKRRELIKNVPLDDVMKVRFFLIAALRKSQSGQNTSSGKTGIQAPVLQLKPKKGVRRNGVVRKLRGRHGT